MPRASSPADGYSSNATSEWHLYFYQENTVGVFLNYCTLTMSSRIFFKRSIYIDINSYMSM